MKRVYYIPDTGEIVLLLKQFYNFVEFETGKLSRCRYTLNIGSNEYIKKHWIYIGRF